MIVRNNGNIKENHNAVSKVNVMSVEFDIKVDTTKIIPKTKCYL